MKITRLYTGSDQKSHFEELELKWRSTAADNGCARGQQRGFSLRSGWFVSRTPPGAAPPVPRDAVRFLGDRSEQRRQAGF